MITHSLITRSFEPDFGRLTATWVGEEGPGMRQILVPVRVNEGDSARPNDWGVRASQTGRPIIQANADPSEGVIIRITSRNGVSSAIGYIYVNSDHADNITLVATGIGANPAPKRGTWIEAIIIVRGQAEFYVQRTVNPDLHIMVDGQKVTQEEVTDVELFYANDEVDWIRVDDPDVTRWRGDIEHSKEGQAGRSDVVSEGDLVQHRPDTVQAV